MILYDYWRSSSAWRVRIALHWKGIPFERRVVNLAPQGGRQQHTPEFEALNPLGQVPVLVTDDRARAIAQSMAIIAYLEEQFPAPPLLPADPWLRARARQLEGNATRLATEISTAVAKICEIDVERVLVVIQPSPARFAVEGGRVLPEPGQEQAWLTRS